MEKFTNYSELTASIVKAVKKDFKKYTALNGCNIDKIDNYISVGVSSELSSTSRKGQAIRKLFKIFGIIFKAGKIYATITQRKDLLLIVNQIEPLIKYFSKDFIEKLNTKIVNEETVNISKPESTTEFVTTLAQNNKLTDYFLANVSDGQFDLAYKDATTTKGNTVASLGTTNKDEEESVSNKEAALKEEVQRLRKQLEKKSVNHGSDELFIERLEDSIVSVAPSLKFINEKWAGDKTFNHSESATEVLHISDWHIGEVDNIGGLNQFNYKIACDRVKTLTNKVISWTKMHRSMYKVDELVIIATGDMISGDIHDELRATNEFPAPEQCVKAAMLISKMANELSSVFKKVRIEYIVADNHSRTTKKMEFAPGTNSYNYIVGTMSQIMLRDNKNIEFNLYPEIEHIIKVEGLNYLITHGNSIRGGQLGLPYYGMTRRLGAEALIRMNMPEDSHFNRIVMGHYHTPLMTNGIEMTGCLSSTTAFDHASGRHSRACQSAWLVSKKFEMDYSVFWLS